MLSAVFLLDLLFSIDASCELYVWNVSVHRLLAWFVRCFLLNCVCDIRSFDFWFLASFEFQYTRLANFVRRNVLCVDLRFFAFFWSAIFCDICGLDV